MGGAGGGFYGGAGGVRAVLFRGQRRCFWLLYKSAHQVLDLYKKQYTVLLKSEKQNREQIKHMSKQINSLSEQLNVLKNVKEKANIFSLNNKKQEIENETD